MVHDVDEHGCFDDVLFCEILRSDGLARHIYLIDFGPSCVDTSDPLRAPKWVMKMKPTIRMSRHDPGGPMAARWGGDLTI
mmetsp:Transcript_23628/g.33746  ORF Transcript_23628/g.33746 Transcript_23628/m.33746 type:complete len:80 (-) Transcript_23628:519-758(-)